MLAYSGRKFRTGGRFLMPYSYDFYAGQEIPEKIDSPLELVTKD
ncbi:hypothetical protein ACSHWD_09040 [Aerococcus urinaeequi]